MDDKELIRQILSGRHDRYTFLVQRYQEPLIHFLRKMVGNDDDAFDCAQEAFLAAYRNLWRYSEEYSFRSWLYAIARNKATDLQRKRKREFVSELEDNLVDHSPGPEERWLEKEQNAGIDQLLNTLPEQYRQILYLRYHQDLTYEEIARALNIPLSRVKTNLHRGKAKLRQEMTRRGMHAGAEQYLDTIIPG